MSEPPPPGLDHRRDLLCAYAGALDVDLTATGAGLLLRYLDAMLAENAAVNLTAIRAPEQALVLHAVDSLIVGRALDLPPARALDLGSGNGFPGIAVRALWPGCRL